MNTQAKASRRRIGLAAFLALASFSAAVAQAQTAIPSTYRLPTTAADATKPGFVFRVHSVGRALPTTLARTESQLAGSEGDNLADPAVTGPALAPATAPSPVSAPITFDVPTVINMEQTGGSGGTITPDDQMPGIPATNGSTEGIAAEVLTWLELPAGETIMGVNSDDGFRVTIGGASPEDKFNSLNVGEFDGGRGAADTIFRITVSEAGLYAARLIWNEGGGGASVEWFTQTADGTKTLIGDPAGLKAYRAVTTAPVKAYVRTALPSPGFTLANPNQRITAELVDGATPIATSSVKLFLDNTDLNVTPTKTGNATTATYTPTTLFPSGSSHNVALVYTEAGTSITQRWNFAVQVYASIPPSFKVTADTTKPGFLWNVFANQANQATTTERAELALGGLLYDSVANGGGRLPNLADPAATGVAAAAGTAPTPDYAPVRFEIPAVINLEQTATAIGNFTADGLMPGVPATDGANNGIAAEILTYIELPAGLVTMGVNSDDGFLTTIGWDPTSRLRAGEFNGGRGATDTIFNMFVQEAGVYPFRTLWQEGGGGANIEWFSVDALGTKTLINATGGLKAYRAVSGGAQPYVRFVNPDTAPRQLNVQPRQVDILLADGAVPIDIATVNLKVDGQAVTSTKTREGASVRIVYAPTTLQVPNDIHTAEVTFRNTGSTTDITRTWQFRNLKNLVLPAAKAGENFDSFPEDGVPTGWVAFNFSSDCAEGDVFDPTGQASDTYKNWSIVSTDNMVSLDGGSANVAPGQILNGQPVETIASGNVLYAESDGRCNSDAGNLNFGQAQFVITKPFDMSQVTNVVLSFSSLYTQNQDSVGAVEYSVDGGTNWLPVVIFIDSVDTGGDIKYRADGAVDALATLNGLNADTANWIENGVAKGDNYGAALATPITQALADYITPRLNDDQTEGHRIEVFRLPAASRKSDVRLRFSQLGTDSWWFAVDNIAFYEDPNAPSGGPGPGDDIRITSTTVSGGNITIVWTGGGTLESAPSLSTPVTWTSTGDSDGTYTAPTTGTSFFRVRR